MWPSFQLVKLEDSQDSSKPSNFHHFLHLNHFITSIYYFQLNQATIFVPFLLFTARNPPTHNVIDISHDKPHWAIPENIHTIPRTALRISEGEGGFTIMEF